MTKLTKPLLTRLVVWVMFATVLIGGALLTNSARGIPDATLNASAAEAQALTSTVQTANPAATLASSSPGQILAAESLTLATNNPTQADASDLDKIRKAQRAVNNLPAWRWSNPELVVSSDSGFLKLSGSFRAFGSGLANIGFLMAALIWRVLLGLLKFGLAAYFVDEFAQTINGAIKGIGTFLLPLLGLAWVGLLIKVGRDFLKGSFKKVITTFLLFTVALGGVAWSALTPDNVGLNRGTVPWVAKQVDSALSVSAAALPSGFGITKSDEYKTTGVSQGSGFTCAAYTEELYKRYNTAQAAVAGSDPATLVLASKMWQNTFFNSLTAAQYGLPRSDIDLGGRVMCHQVEALSGVPTSNATSDNPTLYPQNEVAQNAYKTDRLDPNIFGPLNGEDQINSVMTAWAACDSASSANKYFSGIKNIDGGKCGDVFKTKDADLSKGNFNIFYDDRDVFQDEMKNKSAEKIKAYTAADEWNRAFYGENTGDRFLQGALAFIVSIFFFISFGFIAIGMVLAQIMLVMLLMMIPLTLLFLGLGMPQGGRMLKLTGTTMAAKFIFALLLSFLAEMIGLGQKLIASTDLGGDGLFKQVLYGLMPLLILLLLRKMLKGAGLGDIMKPTGAVSFLAASSLAATRDASLVNMVKNSNKDGGNLVKNGMNDVKRDLMSLPGAKTASDKVEDKLKKVKDAALERVPEVFSEKKREEGQLRRYEEGVKKKEEKEAHKADFEKRYKDMTDKVALDKKERTDVKNTIKNEKFEKRASAAADYMAMTRSERLQVVVKNMGAGALGGLKAAGGAVVAGNKTTWGPGVAAVGAGAKASAASMSGLAGMAALAFGKQVQDRERVRTPGEKTAANITAASSLARAVPESFDANPDTFIKGSEVEEAKDIHRFNTQRLVRSDGAGRTQMEASMVDQFLTNSAKVRVGEDFTGFESDGQKAGAMESYAKTVGLTRNDVIASDSGHIMPIPMSRDQLRKSGNVELASHPVHWLDDSTKKRLAGESDDEYTVRLTTSIAARGMITNKGEIMSAFENMNINMGETEQVVRVQAWLEGGADRQLDTTKFDATVIERGLQAAATAWNKSNVTARDEAQFQTYQQLAKTIEDVAGSMGSTLSQVQNDNQSLRGFGESFSGQLAQLKSVVDKNNGAESRAAHEQMQHLRREFSESVSQQLESLSTAFEQAHLVNTDARALHADDGALDALNDGFTKMREKMAEEVEYREAQAVSGNPAAVAALLETFERHTRELENYKREAEMSRSENVETMTRRMAAEANDQARAGSPVQTVRASDLVGSRDQVLEL